jgi:hypothetical protein
VHGGITNIQARGSAVVSEAPSWGFPFMEGALPGEIIDIPHVHPSTHPPHSPTHAVWDTVAFASNGLVFFWSGIAAINYFIRWAAGLAWESCSAGPLRPSPLCWALVSGPPSLSCRAPWAHLCGELLRCPASSLSAEGTSACLTITSQICVDYHHFPLDPGACPSGRSSIDILGGNAWSYAAIPLIYIFMVLIRSGCLALYNVTVFAWIREREWPVGWLPARAAWPALRWLPSLGTLETSLPHVAGTAHVLESSGPPWTKASWAAHVKLAGCHASYAAHAALPPPPPPPPPPPGRGGRGRPGGGGVFIGGGCEGCFGGGRGAPPPPPPPQAWAGPRCCSRVGRACVAPSPSS